MRPSGYKKASSMKSVSKGKQIYASAMDKNQWHHLTQELVGTKQEDI